MRPFGSDYDPIEQAREIMREALEKIKSLGITPRIRDGAYEPDGSEIQLDNIDFDDHS